VTMIKLCRSPIQRCCRPKLAPNAKLKVYKGAPHGLCTTMKDQVNEDLLAFIKA